MNRKALIPISALFAALLAATLWFVSGDGRRAAPGLVPAAPTAPTTRGAALALSSPVPDRSADIAPGSSSEERAGAPGEGSTRAEAARAEEEPERGALLIEVDGGAWEVRGTLSALEWNGAEVPEPDGRILLRLTCGSGWKRLEVNATRGVWHAALDPELGCTRLEVVSVAVDGRPARVGDPQFRTSIPRGKDLPILVHLPRPSVLRVVDEGSGKDLVDVRLAPAAYVPGLGYEHPGPVPGARITASGLASPVTLDAHLARMLEAGDIEVPLHLRRAARERRPDAPRYSILVGAQGYVWERVAVELLRGRETTLSLSPGADLAVLLLGVDPSVGASLRIYLDGASQPHAMAEDVFGDGRFVFEGLRPGGVRVAAELGPPGAVQAVLAAQGAVLEPGPPLEVVLHCVTPALDLLTDATGILWVPEEWMAKDLTVALRLLAADGTGGGNRHPARTRRIEAFREGLHCFEWSMPQLPVGRYELTVVEPPFQAAITLTASGPASLRHELPPPVSLALRVVDALREEPLAQPLVRWRPAPVVGLPALDFLSVRPHPETDALRLRVPAGTVELEAESEGYLRVHEERTLTPRIRDHEHTLRLLPRTAFAVRCVHDGARVPLPRDFALHVTPRLAHARHLALETTPDERLVHVSDPGRYLLEFPALPGYRPPAPREVEVPPGKFLEVVVELEPE